MNHRQDQQLFQPINRGYNDVFQPGRLSLGLVVPIETLLENDQLKPMHFRIWRYFTVIFVLISEKVCY